ncbi:hypothetical protein VM57_15360 [Stenotrophomonas maltophilia]|uniref:Uncharacterized protein n=1 Tax=Stenotrophomonas maltophilia TaxID=40324 RepID=A0A0F5ZMS4_STEMA|nr:hypothetical protein VM57_15360 [Stenotrophomonas maltophilia]
MQKVGATYTGLMDWVLRPETVVEWLDGGETGPWHDFLWNQAEAAQQQRIELRNRVGGMLEQTMKALTPAQRADLTDWSTCRAWGARCQKTRSWPWH